MITDVQMNGPAARRGVVAGFKIVELNRARVDDMSDVRRIMADVSPGEIVTLHLATPGDTRQIVQIRTSR